MLVVHAKLNNASRVPEVDTRLHQDRGNAADQRRHERLEVVETRNFFQGKNDTAHGRSERHREASCRAGSDQLTFLRVNAVAGEEPRGEVPDARPDVHKRAFLANHQPTTGGQAHANRLGDHREDAQIALDVVSRHDRLHFIDAATGRVARVVLAKERRHRAKDDR